jgi:YfiH family protein
VSLFLSPSWPDQPAGVRAAFTLRGAPGDGGSSYGAYAYFNVAAHVGDYGEVVEANRRLLCSVLGLPAEPTWLRQVHGRHVFDVGRAGSGSRADAPRRSDAAAGADAAPEADAAIAHAPGRVCVIQVADCLPVLFAARSRQSVGAAHAGWRGLAAGVLEATMDALGAPAEDLVAWIGPGIGQAHFEVGDEVREVFVSAAPGDAAAFTPNPRGRWQCDLTSLAERRLRRAGVASISIEGACTYAEAERFYSYRRDGQCGRMAALIWLERSDH